MKRKNNLYEKIYNMDNLKLAYKNAKHNKSWYKEIKEIEKNPNMYFKKRARILPPLRW